MKHSDPNLITFNSIQKEISKSIIMDIETDYLLDVVFATCLSQKLERPLFMMIQAPSSSGKSEVLKLMDGYENFYKQHDLSCRTLFSGHEKAKGGFIPHVIGEEGILCIPDFTTVLSGRSADRSAVFSQLRIAYDGEGGRSTGVDVGNTVNWKGKIACLVTRVDGDIVYINPRGLKLQENMSLFGTNTYNLHDKDEDGFTDRDHDWEIQVKDWKRALEYIEGDTSYSDLFIKNIKNKYEHLYKEDFSKICRGQSYGINNYFLKVSDVIDTMVIAKIVELNHPWVEIRIGDVITLK